MRRAALAVCLYALGAGPADAAGLSELSSLTSLPRESPAKLHTVGQREAVAAGGYEAREENMDTAFGGLAIAQRLSPSLVLGLTGTSAGVPESQRPGISADGAFKVMDKIVVGLGLAVAHRGGDGGGEKRSTGASQGLLLKGERYELGWAQHQTRRHGDARALYRDNVAHGSWRWTPTRTLSVSGHDLAADHHAGLLWRFAAEEATSGGRLGASYQDEALSLQYDHSLDGCWSLGLRTTRGVRLWRLELLLASVDVR